MRTFSLQETETILNVLPLHYKTGILQELFNEYAKFLLSGQLRENCKGRLNLWIRASPVVLVFPWWYSILHCEKRVCAEVSMHAFRHRQLF